MATLSQTQSESGQNSLLHIGGIAGIIAAITFIFGFALFVTVLDPMVNGKLSSTETIEFMAQNQTIIYIWNLVIYVLFGIVQAVLTLALYARLKANRPAISQITAALGLIWSGLVIASGMVANIGASAVIDLHATDPTQAGTIWTAIDTIRTGLGGGNEIVGGLWVMLVSWTAFRDVLPKALNTLGIIVGLAGFVTLVPAFTEVGAIFGLGIIIWYIWIGIVLIRD